MAPDYNTLPMRGHIVAALAYEKKSTAVAGYCGNCRFCQRRNYEESDNCIRVCLRASHAAIGENNEEADSYYIERGPT